MAPLLFSVNNVNFACHASNERYHSKIEIRDGENNDVHVQAEQIQSQSIVSCVCMHIHKATDDSK